MTWEIRQGDCLEVMAEFPENSVDAVVTDPPYGLSFMGREWDTLGGMMVNAPSGSPHARKASVSIRRSSNPTCRNCGGLRSLDSEGSGGRKRCRCDAPEFPSVGAKEGQAQQAWHQRWAEACFRILKPGGHLIAFGGTRTYHRMACAVEDAGFEIRDQLQWLYGSGFPKSLDISKAIDKAAGAEREDRGPKIYASGTRPDTPKPHAPNGMYRWGDVHMPWEELPEHAKETLLGLGGGKRDTAPATESARRWQGWGTALKPAHEPIVLARKPLSERNVAVNVERWGTGGLNVDGGRIDTDWATDPTRRGWQGGHADKEGHLYSPGPQDGVVRPRSYTPETAPGRWPPNVALDESAAAMVDEQSGETGAHGGQGVFRQHNWFGRETPQAIERSQGGASRFMYVAKSDRAERNIGGVSNLHPTVKPVALMAWLCRLVTPPKGLILDPFCGSGSTGIAALREGFSFLGIEREPEYVEIARARIEGDAPLFNMTGDA